MESPQWLYFLAVKKGDLALIIWNFKTTHHFRGLNEIFHSALIHGHLHICKWLLSLPEKFGIDPAAQDNEAFRYAAGTGYLYVCKWLLSLPKHYGVKDPR